MGFVRAITIDSIPPKADAQQFLQNAGEFSVTVREDFARLSAEDRMMAVAAVLQLEQRVFVDLQEFPSLIETQTRQSLLQVLFGLAQAAYGTGLISDREWQQFELTYQTFFGRRYVTG